MNVNAGRVRQCLRAFDFKNLFIQELNWSHCSNRPIDLELDGNIARLSPFAELGGVVVYQVELLSSGEIPPSSLRRQIENKVKQITHEHIIIFIDADRTKSVWQWIRRGGGQQTATREYPYYKGQQGDFLLQKLDGIALDIEELDSEGKIAVIKVLERVTKAFDVEKVTKRFYDEFKTEHGSFCKLLKGLEVEDELAWYASVMLNRLMFIYFIQKKGFLNGDVNYLANKLRESKSKGANQFYRQFLIPLFFQGFAQEEKERSSEVNTLLGRVPYLNGGLFLPHQLEVSHGENINVSDTAFERLFTFFNRYNWHLDYRPTRADNEINPDVLGYIFEKYINQKQMGAYYTKEDITDYICKHTIIPFLLDKLENTRFDELHPFPMEDIEPYIYDAVKQEGYLPTETEREYIARQKRYQQMKDNFTAGKISSINDLITYNLDIRQFAEDWANGIEDPVTLRAFYFQCLTKVKVLDPAVGSGAFLFAALNLLEPLYEICLDKMTELGGPKYQDFAQELERVNQHPNREYFVLKSIIVNNLFGVDIMEEAVEICKLRLFLKLVAQVDDVEKIEPLPDIDFNIRAGNSLVGYATYEQTCKAVLGEVQGKMDMEGNMERIDRSAQAVDRAFQNFRSLQTRIRVDSRELAKAKEGLSKDLGKLEDELNSYLAGEYGINSSKTSARERWLTTHQPFHWFVEFYGIMKDGGFDVIIGNPPYVEYSKIRKEYTIQDYETESCGNTYAFFTERAIALMREGGRFGMIVQLPIVCTDRMKPLQKTCLDNSQVTWFANFDDRPARLFDGLEHIRACIFTFQKSEASPDCKVFTTAYNRWYTENRNSLFSLLTFEESTRYLMDGAIPKIGNPIAKAVRQRLNSFSLLGKELRNYSPHAVYFHNAPQYWIRAMNFVPYFWNERGGEQISSHVKSLYLADKADASIAASVLNSSLFYWWFILLSNCRDLVMREIERFPLGLEKMTDATKQRLTELNNELMQDLKAHSQRKEADYKATGQVAYDEFYPKYSKSIIDEIDRILAKHYGFAPEELDFVINYDIKYRMGKDNEEEE